MRRRQAAVLAVWIWGLAGCDRPAPEPEPLRPVRTESVVASEAGRTRRFSGIARAGQETDLSFRVSGSIERLDAKVGDRVHTGDLIAQLETADFQIAVRRAQASLEQALASSRNTESDLERIRSLWEDNNASQNELDQALAQAQSAEAQAEAARQSLAQAQRQLSYTSLRAPVDGSIASAPMEVSENVSQGQTIVQMTSGSRPEIEVAIPGVLISQIHSGDAVAVRFDAIPGREIPATVTEVGVAATGSATTFPVIVRLEQSNDAIRSGMAADVGFRFEPQDGRRRIYLPAYAVGEDAEGRFVYVLEPAAETGIGVVRRTAVRIFAELTPEGRLEILEGLSEGQQVVTAGVRRLSDGQQVRLIAGAAG